MGRHGSRGSLRVLTEPAAGDEEGATKVASPEAVRALFAIHWTPAYAKPDECRSLGGAWYCAPPGGPYVFEIHGSSVGPQVVQVLEQCTLTSSGYACVQ